MDSVAGLLSNAILSHNADISIKPYYLRPDQENPYRLFFFFALRYSFEKNKIKKPSSQLTLFKNSIS